MGGCLGFNKSETFELDDGISSFSYPTPTTVPVSDWDFTSIQQLEHVQAKLYPGLYQADNDIFNHEFLLNKDHSFLWNIIIKKPSNVKTSKINNLVTIVEQPVSKATPNQLGTKKHRSARSMDTEQHLEIYGQWESLTRGFIVLNCNIDTSKYEKWQKQFRVHQPNIELYMLVRTFYCDDELTIIMEGFYDIIHTDQEGKFQPYSYLPLEKPVLKDKIQLHLASEKILLKELDVVKLQKVIQKFEKYCRAKVPSRVDTLMGGFTSKR